MREVSRARAIKGIRVSATSGVHGNSITRAEGSMNSVLWGPLVSFVIAHASADSKAFCALVYTTYCLKCKRRLFELLTTSRLSTFADAAVFPSTPAAGPPLSNTVHFTHSRQEELTHLEPAIQGLLLLNVLLNQPEVLPTPMPSAHEILFEWSSECSMRFLQACRSNSIRFTTGV
eukprot:2993209-Amphidinium_carterae.1